jgi:hypothetical protein
MASPPKEESKKLVLKFLSNKSIVIPPAKTGKDKRSKTAVISTAQTKRGILLKFIVTSLILMIVTIKLIAPRREDTPARRRLKIARSTELPA